MSGIYIPGMELPADHLRPITARIYSDGSVFTGHGIGKSALVAIPVQDHGRLISSKKLLSVLRSKAFDLAAGDDGEYRLMMWAIKQVESMPSIIPSSEEETT